MKTVFNVLCFCVVLGVGEIYAQPPQYSITDLGGGSGVGLNEVGQVILTGTTHGRADLWQDGLLRELERPDGLTIGLGAINDSGLIAGTSTKCISRPGGGLSCEEHLVFWHDTQATTLATFASGDGRVNGINNSGQIVGRDFTGRSRGFVWRDGVATEIHPAGAVGSWGVGINNLGQVVGGYRSESARTHAFLWDNGTFTDLGSPGGFGSSARSINDRSQIVGAYPILGGGSVGFLWEDGVMTDLPLIPNDINFHGEIVGGSGRAAVIWTDEQLWNLNDLLLGESEWRLDVAKQVNDQGQILGYGINPAGSGHAFLLTPVPEPATIVLMIAGGLCALGIRRRPWAA